MVEAPPRKGLAASLGLSGAQFATVVATYGYVSFWIVASAGVILYNKWSAPPPRPARVLARAAAPGRPRATLTRQPRLACAVLTVWGFNFPISLTMWHMVFCSAVSALLARARPARRSAADSAP